MMKFLYGLVLLVAILPLSAANHGYGISMERVGHNDEECGAVDDMILATLQTCTATATGGDLDVLPYKVIDGSGRALQRRLRRGPDCSDPCQFEACCLYHRSYCGCGDCGCGRRDLEFLDSGETSRELTPQETSRKLLTPEEEVVAIGNACTSAIQSLPDDASWPTGNTCLGDLNQIVCTAILVD